MTTEEIELIKTVIREEISVAVKNRFKPVLSKLDSIQGVVDTQVNNTDEDRKMFAEMVSSQAKVESLTKQMLDMVANITTRIVDKVNEKAQETMETTAQNVADKVEPAMQKVVNKLKNGVPLNQGKPWWAFWRR